MSKNNKTYKQRRRQQIKVNPPNERILDSINSPNAWTPKIEDAWLKELHNITVREIYERFPPFKKPPSIRKRAKGSGWGSV